MKDPCHKLSFCRKTGFKKIDSIDAEKRELVLWRSRLVILNANADSCFHHEQLLTNKYSKLQKCCCNLFDLHKKSIKDSFDSSIILLL